MAGMVGRAWPLRNFGRALVRHLIEEGFLDRDGGMLFIGPEAERRFGYRHFMDLTAVFTAATEFTLPSGRTEIGTTNPALLTEEVAGPQRLLLAGQSWQVTYIDWSRRRCFVEPVDGGGKARWGGAGSGRTASYELTQAARKVLLGTDPPVTLTRRAKTAGGPGPATGPTPPWPPHSPRSPIPSRGQQTPASDLART